MIPGVEEQPFRFPPNLLPIPEAFASEKDKFTLVYDNSSYQVPLWNLLFLSQKIRRLFNCDPCLRRYRFSLQGISLPPEMISKSFPALIKYIENWNFMNNNEIQNDSVYFLWLAASELECQDLIQKVGLFMLKAVNESTISNMVNRTNEIWDVPHIGIYLQSNQNMIPQLMMKDQLSLSVIEFLLNSIKLDNNLKFNIVFELAKQNPSFNNLYSTVNLSMINPDQRKYLHMVIQRMDEISGSFWAALQSLFIYPNGLPPMQGMPPNMQGMPPNMQGMPPQMQGMPPNMQGMPPQMQGMPPNMQGMPPNMQNMPPQMQQPPMQGMPPNMQGMPQQMQRMPGMPPQMQAPNQRMPPQPQQMMPPQQQQMKPPQQQMMPPQQQMMQPPQQQMMPPQQQQMKPPQQQMMPPQQQMVPPQQQQMMQPPQQMMPPQQQQMKPPQQMMPPQQQMMPPQQQQMMPPQQQMMQPPQQQMMMPPQQMMMQPPQMKASPEASSSGQMPASIPRPQSTSKVAARPTPVARPAPAVPRPSSTPVIAQQESESEDEEEEEEGELSDEEEEKHEEDEFLGDDFEVNPVTINYKNKDDELQGIFDYIYNTIGNAYRYNIISAEGGGTKEYALKHMFNPNEEGWWSNRRGKEHLAEDRWFTFSFNKHKLKMTSYTLYCKISQPYCAQPKSWTLYGANLGRGDDTWYVLDTQKDCSNMNQHNALLNFPIAKKNQDEYTDYKMELHENFSRHEKNKFFLTKIEVFGELMWAD